MFRYSYIYDIQCLSSTFLHSSEMVTLLTTKVLPDSTYALFFIFRNEKY